MKFAHKVFHLDKDVEREHFCESMNNYIGRYSSELDTPTIEISSGNDLENFYAGCNVRFTDTGYELNNRTGWRFGELGLWASNIKAYTKFLETDADFLILMEDDIEYFAGFYENLVRYMSQLPEDWDVFFYFTPDNNNFDLSYSPSAADPDRIDVCKAYQDWSTLCYVINRGTAKKILDDISDPIGFPLDRYFFKQPEKYVSYTVKTTSKQYCRIARVRSTFQHKQKREALGGVGNRAG